MFTHRLYTSADCALSIMAKAPHPGKSKTRLVPPLSLEEASSLSGCFLRDTANAIAEITQTSVAQGVVVYTPANEENLFREMVTEDFLRFPQRGEMFGERMIFAFQDLFGAGF